ncbi:MAG: extracellular solute-binding protein [Clostridia bacterium]|nr:extracellular solute-binding protein [Clostridia bacterium]
MRKGIACLLASAMLLITFGAAAEGRYTMAGFDGDGANHDWTTNLFFERMEEKTGVSFEFYQVTDYNTWLATKASYANGADMPDVLFKAGLNTQEMQEWLAAGKIIDLKPYLEEYAPNLTALLKANPDWEKAITLPTGEIPALPYINEIQNNNAMWINRQWLDNLKLSMPTTAQELTEVLRAFKTRDPNNNADDDETPLTFLTMWDLKFLGHAFGLVANDYNIYVDEAGKVQTTLNTAANREFLTWLNQLWEEELLDHHGFSSADTLRAITDEDAPITYGVMLAPTPLTLIPGEAVDQYELLMPMAYQGKQVYRDMNGDLVRGTFAISAGCENPAELISWVDYLYTEEGCRLAQAGLEGVEYQLNGDGTWSWIPDLTTVANQVMAESTIAEGGLMPGLASVEFQRSYDEARTARAINALLGLKEVCVEPYPQVWLTAEQQARVAEIQLELGRYADQTMTWFVTGEKELTDENWAEFCTTLDEKGLQELISIFQNAL